MDYETFHGELSAGEDLLEGAVTEEDRAVALGLMTELAEKRREERAIQLGSIAARGDVDAIDRAVAAGRTCGTYVPGALSTREQ